MSTHRIDLETPELEDEAIINELVRRAIGTILSVFLLATFASVGVLGYLAVTRQAPAQLAKVDAPRTIKRLEALSGQCTYRKVGNYVWYNEHYPRELDMTGGCGLVASTEMTRRESGLSLGRRLAYVDMGIARTNAVFPMRDEEQISVLPDGSSCDPQTWFGCIGRGRGMQTARGLSYGYVAETDKAGLTWGAEAGLFVYEGTWRVHVEPEPPSSFRAVGWTWKGWQLTPYVGASARYGYAFAMARAYGRIRAAEHGCGVCSGVANGPATKVLLGISVPLR